MSTPVFPGDLTPAGLMYQLHCCRMLALNTESDWETHLTEWLSDLWGNIERAVSAQSIDAIRQSEVMQVGPNREVKEFTEPALSGWALVAGALAYHFDEDSHGVTDRGAYQLLIDWAFKQIALYSSVTDDMLTGSTFRADLAEFAEAWGVPALYAICVGEEP